jgi:hypothetical protein
VFLLAASAARRNRLGIDSRKMITPSDLGYELEPPVLASFAMLWRDPVPRRAG